MTASARLPDDDELFRALAAPRRRQILRLVAQEELAAGEIASAFDVTRTAVSQHLSVLRSADLLTERREGARRLYRANPDRIAALRTALDELWASSLDLGRRLVEADRDARGGDLVSGAEALPDNVRPLRPPIRQSTLVRSDAAHTFAVFTGRLAEWWPLVPFSLGGERVREVTLEPRVGGRVYETWDDGTTCDGGEILQWQPPSGLTMTWNATGTPTCVELRFRASGSRLTEVQLEHRGWDALTERELGEDCALPGGYLGGSFAQGWTTILGRLADTAGQTGTDEE
jgi:DNA-binding transcriptional ArsR family regulator/uncharacterized protein YndB with AHSA1/START domain